MFTFCKFIVSTGAIKAQYNAIYWSSVELKNTLLMFFGASKLNTMQKYNNIKSKQANYEKCFLYLGCSENYDIIKRKYGVVALEDAKKLIKVFLNFFWNGKNFYLN